MLKDQRAHITALGPKYILYGYMVPLGQKLASSLHGD